MSEKKKDTEFETELEFIRALAGVLKETGLTEIEIERNQVKLRVARGAVAQTVMAAPMAHADQPSDPASIAQKSAASASTDPGAIKSPMVGTAYLSPSPGAENFIKVGDQVSLGQTLLIVEAMKTMNEIKAPRSGTVKAIFAKDAEPVEYDQPLVILG